MTNTKTVLVVGTFDTKEDELTFISGVIREQGGRVMTMDVSVLGDATVPVDISKHDVATASGQTIADIVAAGDENVAMQAMAQGSALLASDLHSSGAFDAVLVLGGSMGTDLALDLCSALPIGVPKLVVSTVAFSPMIPPERIPADIQMILWAGGLYGLNSICEATLAQAAGSILGAARAARPRTSTRPVIGMTSFGKTVLRYMVHLKPELEARGYELAVFHATGMGGRAFESLAAKGEFAAVLDFAPQEVGNHMLGSAISAGPDRLTGAGRAGVPQIVSIGCYDLVDLVGWHDIPVALQGQEIHAHNRLISAVAMTQAQRRAMARMMCAKLAEATGPTTILLPLHGGNEWDRTGGILEDKEGLQAFIEELRLSCPKNVILDEIDAHINDEGFAVRTLKLIDDWRRAGTIE
ncbi:MAG: Tm-1-like ATP-binding domain-containing protein [Pseudomonadota bacterium]